MMAQVLADRGVRRWRASEVRGFTREPRVKLTGECFKRLLKKSEGKAAGPDKWETDL